MELQITKNTETIIATFSGRLDTTAASQLNNDIKPLLDNADKHIILDCANLTFISSSGLRLFLTIRKATIAQGGNVTIRNTSNDIKQVFTITGFNNLFDFEQ